MTIDNPSPPDQPPGFRALAPRVTLRASGATLMSYKQCIFGIPTAAASEADVLALVRECMADLDSQGLNIPKIYVLIDSDVRARRTGLRTFMIGARDPGGRTLTRAPLFEFMFSARRLPVVALLHDDQHGVYLFERYDPKASPRLVQIVSDGPYLGTNAPERLTVDYPQKQFSNARLRALHDKPESKLTGPEARAIMDYHNAVAIGLRQFFPRWRGSCLDVLQRKNAWRVYHPRDREAPPRKYKKPDDWHNFVAYWLEDDDWRLAGLPPRYY
jgi:hypothetical protein